MVRLMCDLCGSTEDVEVYSDIALCPRCAKALAMYIKMVHSEKKQQGLLNKIKSWFRRLG